MTRRKSNIDDVPAEPSFEEALAGLETIVEGMEHQQLPLEELVAYYEQGSRLLDRCEALLQSARSRIELITLRNKNDNEAATATATDPPPDSHLPSGPPDATNDDDIRLF